MKKGLVRVCQKFVITLTIIAFIISSRLSADTNQLYQHSCILGKFSAFCKFYNSPPYHLLRVIVGFHQHMLTEKEIYSCQSAQRATMTEARSIYNYRLISLYCQVSISRRPSFHYSHHYNSMYQADLSL